MPFMQSLLTAACCCVVLLCCVGGARAVPSTVVTATDFQLVATVAVFGARSEGCGVTLSDDTLLQLGGVKIEGNTLTNEVFKSVDKGTTWTQVPLQTGSPVWTGRSSFSCVRLADDTIVLSGGRTSGGGLLRDVWISTDVGASWTQQTASAPWSARANHLMIADGQDLYLLGGLSPETRDVWKSTDSGASWSAVTTSAPWSARSFLVGTSLGSSGELLLVGGHIPSGGTDRIWYSADGGVTWVQKSANGIPTGPDWRGMHFGRMSDGTLWAAGGWSLQNPHPPPHTLVWYSHDDGDNWQSSGDLPITAALAYGSSFTTSTGDIIITAGTSSTWGKVNTVYRVDGDVPPPRDEACSAGQYGMDCSCTASIDFPAGSQVSAPQLSTQVELASGAITFTASSGPTGALQHPGRTVTHTEVRVQTAAGQWCTHTVLRSSLTCTGCDSAPYSCSNTDGITLADLRAECGAALFAEQVPGEASGTMGLQVQLEVFYTDDLTDAFGGSIGTASHSAAVSAFLLIGGAQTVKGAATGDMSVVDVQVAGTVITPAGASGDADAEMDVTILFTHPVGTTITVTGGPTKLSSGAGFDTASGTTVGLLAAVCTSSRCASTAEVQLSEAAADCDFSGTFSVDIAVSTGASTTYSVVLAGSAGTDACAASTVGSSGVAVASLTAETPAVTGILGSAGGAVTYEWTSAAQLQADTGTNIDSTLDRVEMVLQTAGTACSDPATITDLVTVYEPTGFTPVLTSGGANMVTVTDNGDKSDAVQLAVGTADLAELADLGAAGFADLASTYVGQVCVVVTRSAQVGVQLPGRRRLRTRSATRIAAPRLLSDASVEEAAQGSSGRLIVAAPGQDTSIYGSLLLSSATTYESGLSAGARSRISAVTEMHIARLLSLPPSSVYVHTVARADGDAGNSFKAQFVLVLPRQIRADATLATLQASLRQLSDTPETSQLASDINIELLAHPDAIGFEVVGGSATQLDSPAPRDSDTGDLQPWMLPAAAGVAIVVLGVLVAFRKYHRTSHTSKVAAGGSVRTISVAPSPSSGAGSTGGLI